MIYFIQAGKDGPIKIGLAVQPESRKKNLQTAHYEELKIIGILEGGIETEKMLHIQFGNYRIRGEWFRPSEAILSYISNNAQYVKKNITQKLAEGQYRIIFHTPVKATINALLIFGNQRLSVILDGDNEWILGIEGAAIVLKEALPKLGVTSSIMKEYLDVIE